MPHAHLFQLMRILKMMELCQFLELMPNFLLEV